MHHIIPALYESEVAVFLSNSAILQTRCNTLLVFLAALAIVLLLGHHFARSIAHKVTRLFELTGSRKKVRECVVLALTQVHGQSVDTVLGQLADLSSL